MMRQRGLDAAMSRVAMVGEQAVGVWLVSRQAEAGYLISSATRPAFRGRGVAATMAQESLGAMRAAGVRTFETEVMQGNEGARRVYARLGMREKRGLQCYDLTGGTGQARDDALAGDWAKVRGAAALCRDWAPTWQNDDAAVARAGADAATIAVWDDGGLAAYAVAFAPTSVVAQIAVRPDRRRQGIGRALLAKLGAALPGASLRVLNADAGDAGFDSFMQAVGAIRTVGQRALHMVV